MKTIELKIQDKFWQMIKKKIKVKEFRKIDKFQDFEDDEEFNIIFTNLLGNKLGTCKAYFYEELIVDLLDTVKIVADEYACDENEISSWNIQKEHLDFLLNQENGYFKDLNWDDNYAHIHLLLETLETEEIKKNKDKVKWLQPNRKFNNTGFKAYSNDIINWNKDEMWIIFIYENGNQYHLTGKDSMQQYLIQLINEEEKFETMDISTYESETHYKGWIFSKKVLEFMLGQRE